MRGACAGIALALAAAAGAAAPAMVAGRPVVVASGAYPEGLLWHGGQMYFTEMGADRISIVADGGSRQFRHLPGCGPTAIAPFGAAGFLVACHLSRSLVELSAQGAVLRQFRAAPDGSRFEGPNAGVGDGRGGAYFSDSGVFDLRAAATGRVYHVSGAGALTEVIKGIRYANGVAFEPGSRTLFVSEHLNRRIHALTLDSRHRVGARRVFTDFVAHAGSRDYRYPLAGPDGLALHRDYLVAAEYGEGRVHVFARDGRLLRTLGVTMSYVDTVAFDGAGSLYAGGAFQNARPPFEGAVVRFAPGDWEPP